MAEMPRLMTAMLTPFDEGLSLDVGRARELAAKLVDEGNDGLVVTGTTGEAPALSHEEKERLWAAVVAAVGGRAMVVAGTGTNSTRDSIELSKVALGVGAHAVMLVAPYYNKPSQEGLYQHFVTAAEAIGAPVVLYNVPPRTASNIEAATVVRAAKAAGNIVAVKEASSDMGQIASIRRNAPPGFVIYSGNDSDTLPMMALGAVGVISVAGHLVGRDLRTMIDRFHAGDIHGALELHLRMLPIFEACFVPGSPNPCPVKAAMEMVGFGVGKPRLPLVPPNPAQCEVIRRALADYGLVT